MDITTILRNSALLALIQVVIKGTKAIPQDTPHINTVGKTGGGVLDIPVRAGSKEGSYD
jgi:hypothetical protein